MFAIDSVPSILAITDDAFIVFAANAFALLGLAPLFFLVADLVERLYYLKTALAALLVLIGIKMAAGELWGKLGPEYLVAGDRARARHRRRGLAAARPADRARGRDAYARLRVWRRGDAARLPARPSVQRITVRTGDRTSSPITFIAASARTPTSA